MAIIAKARNEQGLKGSEESEAAKQLRHDLQDEKLKQARLQTQQEELKLREKEGELLPRAGWELFAATLLTELGDWRDQLPDLIAADFPRKYAPKLRARLKDELDRRCIELAKELERKARELDEATAE